MSKKDNKVCCIFNIGPHYRKPIYQAIAKNINCDYYIGDKMQYDIKTFEYETLTGFKKRVHNVHLGKFYWQRDTVRLLFKPYKYYIIDGEPFCLSSWCILLLSKLIGKKVIPWTHGWYGRESIVKKIIKKVFFKMCSKLMVYGEYAIGLMRENGFAKKEMYCIANSLDSYKQLEIRKCLKITDIFTSHFKNENPIILYCGRIQKSKKLEMIIDCAKKLKDLGLPVNVVIVGKDSEGVNLEEYTKKAGLEDYVWMYGPCYDEMKLGEIFYNSAVCVSPGNVGLTAIHAMTFGCPVITHGNFPYQGPEFEAIVKGVTGDFFEQDSTDDLVEKVKSWIYADSKQRDITRTEAFKEIDRKWNIDYQIGIIKKAVDYNE